jgi:hypothetical protein
MMEGIVAGFDIHNMSAVSLAELDTQDIIKLVLALKEENKKLLADVNVGTAQKYDDRLEKLEREMNLTKQYIRRDCIEITGIPDSVEDNKIEDAVINVIKAAEAKVHNRYPSYMDIQAAHRKGRNGVVICKFVNRKHAFGAIVNSSKLKGKDVFENGGKVYVNASLCPEFAFLHYAVRKAKKEGEIHSYKVRHGVMSVCMEDGAELVEISHENDLRRNNISVPDRKY